MSFRQLKSDVTQDLVTSQGSIPWKQCIAHQTSVELTCYNWVKNQVTHDSYEQRVI
jgi:hypothetical protein